MAAALLHAMHARHEAAASDGDRAVVACAGFSRDLPQLKCPSSELSRMNPYSRSLRRAHLLALVVAQLSWAMSSASAYEVDQKQNRIVLSSVDDFTQCQNDLSYSDACLDALKRYIKAHPADGFAAGKLVRARFNHWMALQFFVPALAKPTPSQCEDEDLRLAVLSGLSLPDDDPNVALAVKAAQGACAANLQPHIRNGLGDGSALYKKNAAPLLAKRKTSEKK